MTQPIRILHLEDDLNDAELLALHLESAGIPHTIVHVKSHEEFSAALERGTFDVILADNSGPSFTGRDALTLARQKLPHTAFLFVSGSIEGEAANVARRTSDGFVLKHKLSELVPAIQHALQTKKK